MRILFLGDVVGRSGRTAVQERLGALRSQLSVDFCIVNAENAAAGFGLTGEIADALFAAGADALTLGNHAFDQREIMKRLDEDPRILRPMNWPRAPGRGAHLFEPTTGPAAGKRILVANILGRIFMNPMEDPFSAADALLRQYPLGAAADAIVLDMHAEATSEKMAFGHFVDGRASLVVGTHTHVPTADAMILSGGTAYQSDVGMCGAYDSVIGMDKVEPMKRFIMGLSGRAEAAKGAGSVCGALATLSETGLARRIEMLRLGGPLPEAMPEPAAP